MSKKSSKADAQKARRRCNGTIVVIVTVLVALISYVLYNVLIGAHPAEILSLPTPQKVGRYKMNISTSYREIADQRRPCVLTGTIVDRWRARTEWSTEFLKKRIPHVMAYRQESQRIFTTFHDGKPLEPLVNEKWEDYNIKVNTTLEIVLGKPGLDAVEQGPYLYYSEKVADLKRSVFQNILDYIQPIKDLILSEESVQVNLWVGRKGIVTNTHYDMTYNFFVQLQGKKHFTLFPPNAQLYLYPCLHPHYGHSQVDILSPDLTKYPLYSNASVYTAVLGPGDMLTVPPFWLHHVETLEESVSVNVWSDSPEYATINDIYSKPIPFEEEWGLHDRVFALRIYLGILLTSLTNDDPEIFLLQLTKQRYEWLVLSGNIHVNRIVLSQLRMLCNSEDTDSYKHEDRDKLVKKFKENVARIAPLFNELSKHGTCELLIGNYIEHLVHTVLGIDYVFAYLSNCYSTL
ncbi:tRNA wybutosine-synthesizing protein 5-like [Dysidea avara]|uniref:tRNA wybutosine-synthesizing protein 5-like n=1 Tax=Dysidea avara TaxID=196820 RepID=UPI00332F8107